MTQWLIEEAAFLALELEDVKLRQEATEEAKAEHLLLARHAELTAMREATRGVR